MRVHHKNNTDQKYIELKIEERHKLWVLCCQIYELQLRN